MRITSLLKYDILLLFKHGFYYVYLAICVVYIVILNFAPSWIRENALPMLIYSDPSVMGFFIVGAFLLLERGQKTLQNIFITTIEIKHYFMSRLLSILIMNFASSLLIVLFVAGSSFNFWLLCLGIIPTSAIFTLWGIGIAAGARNISYFLVQGILALFLMGLPLARLFYHGNPIVFGLVPGYGSIVFIWGSFKGVPSPAEFITGFLNLLLWTVLSWIWAYKRFYKKILIRIGEGL